MTKKRYFIAILSAVIIIVATLSILLIETKDHETKSVDIDLYFYNESYTSIVAEKRNLKYENTKELAHIVINELIKGPQDSKNNKIIPEDARILSCKQKYNDVIVDFSGEYLLGENSNKYFTTYAIVKSMCQIQGVDEVLVTVEGEEIVADDGTTIGYMSAEDIDLVTDVKTQDSKSLKLYFLDDDEDLLLGENRTIKITDTLPLEHYAVNELIKGTESQRRRNILAPDTELISAETTDSTCFVNFKSGFIEKNTGNGKNEELVLYSIVNSLCEIENVNSVVFLVDGKKVEKFGEIDISSFFEKNESLILK